MDKTYLATPELLARLLFDPAERVGLRLRAVYMNAVDFADVRKFGRDAADIETSAELIRSGHVATLFGVPLRVRRGDRTRPAVGTVEAEDSSGETRRVCLRCCRPIRGLYCSTGACIVEDVYEA